MLLRTDCMKMQSALGYSFIDADHLSESKCFSEETIFLLQCWHFDADATDYNPTERSVILNRTIEGLNDEDKSQEQLLWRTWKISEEDVSWLKYATYLNRYWKPW